MNPMLRHALGADCENEFVRVDGTRLAFTRRGKGLPLLCLHATGHGGGDFSALAKRLHEMPVEIMTLDWPGQGRSDDDGPDRPASASRYAQLLDEVIPRVAGDRKVVLLGNSIGGAAAIRYAARQPDRIAALIICDAGGLAPLDPFASRFIGLMVRFFGAGARGARWFPQAFALYYQTILPAKPALQQRRRIVAAIRETAPVVQQAWQSFADPAEDLTGITRHLAMPVLYAWSRGDRVVSYSRSQAAIASTPHGIVRMFDGGHSAFLEDPDAFAAALIAFLKTEGLLA